MNVVLRGTYMLHSFICWQMDSMEYLLNQEKPYVMESDIEEVSDYWILDGIDKVMKVSKDFEKEKLWYSKSIQKLNLYHRINEMDPIGTPVTKDFFNEIG